MNTVTTIKICCPNCGSPAERHILHKEQMLRTQCPACDYLMITCSQTGRVIEAYAPGIEFELSRVFISRQKNLT
jgi:uncharacterized Zn finger protein